VDSAVIDHISEQLANNLASWHDVLAQRASGDDAESKGKFHWTDPPPGVSLDRLKACHMALKPVNMNQLKKDGMSWETLCMPEPTSFTDAASRGWVAEVRRRLLLHNGKVRVENPEYYWYDHNTRCWKEDHEDGSIDVERIFSTLAPGAGVFALLKTAAEFGKFIRWDKVQLSLEGAVDMRLLEDRDVEKFNETIMDMVLSQMIEDKVIDKKASRDEKRQKTERWLRNEFSVFPEMVMATLLNLGIVETDPAWDDFV